MRLKLLLLVVAVSGLSAGCLQGGEHEGHGAELDTGSIQPGEVKLLSYPEAGAFAMHCHPHPFMRHNVTVDDAYAGPSRVHVDILDGQDVASYRFEPANLTVGVGTKVEYHNHGNVTHTSTQET